MAQSAGLRIEGAAAATGLTTRNIRAYQALGLIPSPRLDGRVGRYDRGQLERLRAVRRLQADGFSLAGIGVLFDTYDRGESLERLLGFTPADVAPPSPSLPPLALVPGPLADVLEATA